MLVQAAAAKAVTIDDSAYFAAAVVIGFRDASFFQLLKRGTDLVLAPGGEKTQKPNGFS